VLSLARASGHRRAPPGGRIWAWAAGGRTTVASGKAPPRAPWRAPGRPGSGCWRL